MFGHTAFAETAFAELPDPGNGVFQSIAFADVAFVGASLAQGVLTAAGSASVVFGNSEGAVLEIAGIATVTFMSGGTSAGVLSSAGTATVAWVARPPAPMGMVLTAIHRGTINLHAIHRGELIGRG